MAHIVKVDGIEMFATARGHSLECDECGDNYTGGNHEDRGGPYKPNGYRGIDKQLIVADAMRLGWTGLEKYQDPEHAKGEVTLDRCPVCSVMRKAPYWPTLIHEPLVRAEIAYQSSGPLVQKHTVVRSLSPTKLHIHTKDWPVRDRYNEPPAILDIKLTANEIKLDVLTHFVDVRWIDRKPTENFKNKAPLIRLWSWGDGKIYAKELIQLTK